MRIEDSVALVTGANRGLGRAFTRTLLDRGARRVYAGARDPGTVPAGEGITPVKLDITNPEDIADAVRRHPDVTLLINNAGVSGGGSLLASPVEGIRGDFETNFFGTLNVSRAFAPVLAANGGGALVNVLSVLSFVTMGPSGSYSASKSAEWSLTNALRLELREQGTQVLGVHVGYIDTDMAAHITGPKNRPEDVVAQVLDALAEGRHEVLADDLTRTVKGALSGDLAGLYPALA
ncbi:SDR family oxidoreductase [Rugosimonospora africana]|uniref:Short-chain dehydrogenase n=1 Tax=Rugosimonospora africana TaxID=556532 RepID=A0A8J3QWE7_9ACTN|nr:SDR family oxidoreductase [Rugosimonospora africana]GIH18364.1 short-chain dehydrogenase [Rugosimonospora africana]